MNLETMRLLIKVANGYKLYYDITSNIKYYKKAMRLYKEIWDKALLKEVA